MRNALNKLADTVTDPAEKKVSRNPSIPLHLHLPPIHFDMLAWVNLATTSC